MSLTDLAFLKREASTYVCARVDVCVCGSRQSFLLCNLNGPTIAYQWPPGPLSLLTGGSLSPRREDTGQEALMDTWS